MEGIQPFGHPLDPLSAAEIAATAATVRAHPQFADLSPDTRFITMELAEPDKSAVAAWSAGGSRPPRVAEVVMLDRGSEASVEVTVSLDQAAVTGWRVRTDIQPMAVISELMEAEELVRLHPDFQAAMASAGSPTSRRCRSTLGRRVTSETRARTVSGWGGRSPSCVPTPATASGPTRWTV